MTLGILTECLEKLAARLISYLFSLSSISVAFFPPLSYFLIPDQCPNVSLYEFNGL